MILFGVMSGCCAGLAVYAVVFFNPILILCGCFFAALLGKEAVKMYWIVLDMFEKVNDNVMSTWIKATSKVVNELGDHKSYVVIYDGGKVGKFLGEYMKIAYRTKAVILDWIIEMPI